MEFLLVVFIPFITTLILTPLVMRLALRWGFKDDPQTHHHPAILHRKALPRAGGLPIYIALVVSILIFCPLEKHLIGLILGATIIVIDGLLDDRYNLHPLLRFISQFVAAGIIVLSGVGITYITNPFGGLIRLDVVNITLNFFGEHHLLLLADLFALFWIVWTMNLVNWSSGVDGQMPGFVIIAAGTLALLALPFTTYDASQWTVIKICLMVVGATLAFLIFNWHPAKILPGDSASMLLGFFLAVLAILSGGKVATAVLVLGIPTLDAAWAILRRVSKKRLPIWGDRKHLHHQLLDLGLSQRQVAVIYWILTAILRSAALLFSGRQKLWLLIVLGGLLAFFLILIHRFMKAKAKKVTV